MDLCGLTIPKLVIYGLLVLRRIRSESKVVFDILGIPVTENVVWTWGIMAVLIAASFLLSRNLKRAPTGFQHVTELIVDGLEGLVVRVMGSRGRVFVPFIIALALFILLANFASILPGGVSPISQPQHHCSPSRTGAACFCTVLRLSKGLKTYIKGYFSPYFILFPSM